MNTAWRGLALTILGNLVGCFAIRGRRSKKENEFNTERAHLKVKLVRMTTILQS